jgi:hypothetical protein
LEIEGTIAKLLDKLPWAADARFHTKCNIEFINTYMADIKWSHVDANESMTPIADDMIADSILGNPIGRKELRTRNSQQSVLYLSVFAACLNHYCDAILPGVLDTHDELRGSPMVGCVLACRELAAKVRMRFIVL